MKLSILLPTRNGGHLLDSCIRSVLAEDFSDMELVVSDNASTDDTGEVLERFGHDSRLKTIRLNDPVPVTENWRTALAASSGEYVLLIGDDDYLLPGYCRRVQALLARYGEPDCLTYNAYAFAFPNSLAGVPHAHFADPFYPWDRQLPAEGPIPRAERVEVVHDLFRFRFRIHLNMQTTLVARRALARLKRGVFKPPFPDFYAINALLLTAETWAYVPEKPLVVGISPKSFGNVLHSASQDRGLDYLDVSTAFDGYLPGDEMLSGTYRCLLDLQRDYPKELTGVEIARGDYVSLQAYRWYTHYRLGLLSRSALLARARLLSTRDWLTLLSRFATRAIAMRERLRVDRTAPVQQMWPGLEPVPDVTTIGEFAEWITRRWPHEERANVR